MNTDPIADLLTRIRNASRAGQSFTTAPYSKLKQQILEILKQNGFIEGVKIIQQNQHKDLKILLPKSSSYPLSLRRVSKPGRRVYQKANELKSAVQGFGVYVVSTSQGLMTSDEAREQNLGGEVLCEVF
jgi:small subunit ribosomal protein S8